MVPCDERSSDQLPAHMDEVAREEQGVQEGVGPGQPWNYMLPQKPPAWISRLGGYRPRFMIRSRRGDFARGNDSVDWKETITQWLRYGKIGWDVAFYPYSHQAPRVVVLWDISGSMNEYVGRFFPFVYGMAHSYGRVGVFPFGVRVHDISMSMQRDWREAIRDMMGIEELFGSGTLIGQAFNQWITMYGDRWLHSDTSILIISDGWDVGQQEDLATALKTFRHRANKIFWVNPLMATAHFSPETSTLRTILQYSDRMIAGEDIPTLITVFAHMVG